MLGVVIQLCQAACKDAGDGLRDRHEVARIEVRQTPARACVPGELHNEERVPAAQFNDPVPHLRFDPAFRNGVHQFRGSLPAEFAEKELARLVSHQGTAKQPADGVLLMQAIRPGRQHDGQWEGRPPLQNELQTCYRIRINPLEIIDEENGGLVAGNLHEQPPDCFKASPVGSTGRSRSRFGG